MPIYEFYCSKCHTIFNFLSHKVNTRKQPFCPKCNKKKLERRVSLFAAPRGAKENADTPVGLPDIDERRMEKAMTALAGEVDKINEDDPRQAAELMRKFSDMTGMNLGPGMEEAINRMEAGEDPEQIEAEMGDLIEGKEPFLLPGGRIRGGKRRRPPKKDDELYSL